MSDRERTTRSRGPAGGPLSLDARQARFREGMTSCLDALEAAQAELGRKPVEAADTARRLARRLRGTALSMGSDAVARIAAGVADAGEGDLAPRVGRLLEAMRALVKTGHAERAGVLVVEDDELTAHALASILRAPGRAVFTAASVGEARATLAEQPISLVLLDLALPDEDGRALLLSLRERQQTAGLPVLVTSGLRGSLPKAECFALGAEAFFEKPLDFDVVATAAAAHLQRATDIARESRRDALTGLANRAAFEDAFSRVAASSRRNKTRLALGLLDLDHFKAVNDAYGHVMGDEVLRRATQVVARSLRASDLPARWGGEEFSVLFPHTSVRGAARALEHAAAALRRELFVMADGRSFRVTFSAGVVEVADDESLEDAVSQADLLLYMAKAAGRDRVLTPSSRVVLPRTKVVVAEDDELFAALMQNGLEADGFEVGVCRTGAELAATLDKGRISLLILDVLLPDVDGFQVLERLRSSSEHKGTPVILVTSLGSEQDVLRGFELGADDYVLKPFSPKELLARARRLMRRA